MHSLESVCRLIINRCYSMLLGIVFICLWDVVALQDLMNMVSSRSKGDMKRVDNTH